MALGSFGQRLEHGAHKQMRVWHPLATAPIATVLDAGFADMTPSKDDATHLIDVVLDVFLVPIYLFKVVGEAPNPLMQFYRIPRYARALLSYLVQVALNVPIRE